MVGRHEKWRQQEERRKEGERRQEKRHAMPVPATPTGVVELGQGAGEAVRCIVRLPGGVKLGQAPARVQAQAGGLRRARFAPGMDGGLHAYEGLIAVEQWPQIAVRGRWHDGGVGKRAGCAGVDSSQRNDSATRSRKCQV
jgi:hypothetical protein